MSSILAGYEYDIFISYRHKDNEYDGWVSEFVSNLRRDLHATFKEEISIYFDENLEDGILESHHVDGTVNNKIRCLIFIPILSQTYCDEKSFAWQHEFVPFNRFASNDRFGREIKLNNGNVSSRVLPVRIHELDREDKALFENEIGSVLRSIDFIYKSAGVNRPLKPNDDRTQNYNHTYYRDQINKVANAIKELIAGLKCILAEDGRSADPPTPAKMNVAEVSLKVASRKSSLIWGSLLLLIVFLPGFYFYFNQGIPKNSPDNLSIAVLPFDNLSNDPDQEYFSDGITDQIITTLSRLDNVKVIGRTSVMKYKNTLATIPEIGRALRVNYVLEGSVQKAGNRLKINAQLIRVHDNFHAWADIYKGDLTDIFKVQDDVSHSISQALGTRLSSSMIAEDRPSSAEAYDYFLQAKHIAFTQYYWASGELNEIFLAAENLYKKAIVLEPSFALPYAGLADLYDARRNHGPADFPEELNRLRFSLSEKAFDLDPNSAFVNNVRAYMFWHRENPDLDSAHYFLRRAVELDPADPYFTWALADFYSFAGLALYEKALPYLTKAREINPADPSVYAALGATFWHLGHLEEASEAFNKAIALGGKSHYAAKWHVISWLLMEGQIETADELIALKSLHTEVWKTFVDAAYGKKAEVLQQKKLYPAHYLLLGMKKEALQAIEASIDRGESWYLALNNIPAWKSLTTEPTYERVLEKARVLHEKNLERFGFK